jgi:phage internal scaffolding protein
MTKNVVKFKTPYDGERNAVKMEVVGDSLTQQHFKDETDIQKIIKQYDRTGLIRHVARGVAQYGDYSQINEYREALDVVMMANASFMELPAAVRRRFNNDAGEFFEFATNPANAEEMVAMGLAEAPVDAGETSPTPATAASSPAESQPSEGAEPSNSGN